MLEKNVKLIDNLFALLSQQNIILLIKNKNLPLNKDFNSKS